MDLHRKRKNLQKEEKGKRMEENVCHLLICQEINIQNP
jgi:hypothetical protein